MVIVHTRNPLHETADSSYEGRILTLQNEGIRLAHIINTGWRVVDSGHIAL